MEKPLTRNIDDGCGSEASTLKGILRKADSSDSVRTYVKARYVNSATSFENGLKSDSDDDEDDFGGDVGGGGDMEQQVAKPSVRRVCKIDLSPEAEEKRKKIYNNWLQSVVAREKVQKRLEREQREAELQEKLKLEEERQKTSSTKVREWMRKKEIQADKKIAKLNVMKKEAAAASVEPKQLKKAINFQDWLAKKNEMIEAQKKQREMKKQNIEDYQKCRKTVSLSAYEKWIRSSSSKPKPVPMNKGLESLRGSTTKIHINPIPWESIDDWE